MSHAAIVNPLANLGPPMFPMSGGGSANQSTQQQPQPQHAQLSPQEYQQMPQLSGAPQMPMLKPAPNMKSPANGRGGATNSKDIKLNSDGKPIKKGELDPSTMIHVPGGNKTIFIYYFMFFLSLKYTLVSDAVAHIHGLFISACSLLQNLVLSNYFPVVNINIHFIHLFYYKFVFLQENSSA